MAVGGAGPNPAFRSLRIEKLATQSSKFVRTGHNTYEVDGDFSIRRVSNPEEAGGR